MPYFSVIIPVYNTSQYLEQCVDSILAQDFSDYEIILVDNGSTDASRDICYFYSARDERIKVINLPHNRGVSVARNIGMELATGHFWVFVDSDDYWMSNCILTRINKLTLSDPYIDVVRGNFMAYESGSNEPISCIEGEHQFSGGGGSEVIKAMVKRKQCYDLVWRYFFKSELHRMCHLTFLRDIIYDDNEWILKLMQACNKVVFIGDEFYAYRVQREGALTSTTYKQTEEVVASGIRYVDSTRRRFTEIARNEYVYLYYMDMYARTLESYARLNIDKRIHFQPKIEDLRWFLNTNYKKALAIRFLVWLMGEYRYAKLNAFRAQLTVDVFRLLTAKKL